MSHKAILAGSYNAIEWCYLRENFTLSGVILGEIY